MTDMKNIDIESMKNTDVFKVPDNYFDNITDRIMSRIDAEDSSKVISISKNRHNSGSWWKWSSIAACITLAIVSTAIVSKNLGGSSQQNVAEVAGNEYMSQEDMLEYTMIDRSDVYCYLSGEEY